MPTETVYDYLSEQFREPDERFKLAVYFDAKQTDASSDAAAFVRSFERRDVGCIIPRISEDRHLDPGELEHFRHTYAAMLRVAREKDMHIAFNLEGAIEDAVISGESDLYEDEMRSKVLHRREYRCSREENVRLCLHDGCIMAVVAFDESNGGIIDLREYVSDGVLNWQAPRGNWTVTEYMCDSDEERNYVNVLSYDSSMKYLETAYSLFADVFHDYRSRELNAMAYSNVCFSSRNRRDWDPAFNEVFEKRYGFDPSPYYPLIFSGSDDRAEHFKALFFDCRAAMLADGMIKALHDFADRHGFRIIGSVAEPKLSACSFVNGDALLDSAYAPGALYDRAYMYGTNSVKIAAAASYNFGKERVSCELFRDYYKISKNIMYNDMLNAYARGANVMAAHMPVLTADGHTKPEPFVKSVSAPAWQGEFAAFTSRTQALLRGGAHVADIALLYPIYTIHSKVNFYEADAEGFEYPYTPDNIDYMTVINCVSMFTGHDLTVLHPTTLSSRCRIEGNELVMSNGRLEERFSVFILPATEMISLGNARVLRDFYRAGGHIIATGELPHLAFEYDERGENDLEVCRIMREVFGEDATSSNIIRDFCRNSNENGGEACFLCFNRTAADGTNMASSHAIFSALESFSIPYDIYLPGMPRFEATGALNCHYVEFVRLGLNSSIPGGGMLNHIHKRRGTTDIYYFSNTTERDYNHIALMRGRLSPESWNPHTLEMKKLDCRYIFRNGRVYTEITLDLKRSTSIFIISDAQKNAETEA